MFDVVVGGVTYRESEFEDPGEEIVTASLGDADLGLTVCYDLRFPELYRILALRGARVISVPSAFTATTGRDHWEVLLRARAIENQVFLIAPNQIGEAPPQYDSYGHSAIVDPWGEVLAIAPTRSASSPPTSTSPPRIGSASRCPRSPTAGPRPTPGRSSWRRTPDGLESAPDRQAPPDPRRGDQGLRPPGLPLDPGLRHRRRGRRRLRARLPLLQLQGGGAERALHRALVAAARRDRRGRRRRPAAAREARGRSPPSSSSPTATTRS